MNYYIIPVTPLYQNCSLIWCKKTFLSALIDPGGDIEKIRRKIDNTGLVLTKILLTHGHVDHVGIASELSQDYGVPILGPNEGDRFLLKNLPAQSRIFGLKECKSFTPNFWLNEGDIINVGNIVLNTLHCPGHTPGHIVFFIKKLRLLISGDVIFKDSIGRSDFLGGNYSILIKSIKQKLLPLGDDVTFIAGHGPKSTLGYERLCNPYLK